MVKLLYITANLLKKVPPRQILKSNYVGQTHIISFHHKDAIGRDKKCNDWRWKFITKTDIINEIWKENINIYTKKDIEFIINSFIKIIGDKIKNNINIKIDGFGTFSTYYKNVHISKSIDTGIENNIPAVKCISFKPSKKLKE